MDVLPPLLSALLLPACNKGVGLEVKQPCPDSAYEAQGSSADREEPEALERWSARHDLGC